MLQQLLDNYKKGVLTFFAFVKRKDKRSVRQVTISGTGSLKNGKPSLYLCLSCLLGGSILIVAPIISGYNRFRLFGEFPPVSFPFLAFRLIVAGCCLANGVFLLRLRRQMSRLSPAKSVSVQLGVDEQTLQQMAQEHGIKPRYTINEEDYYDPADLGDVATLLRASAAPVKQEELLRAAAHTETSPDTLLRASNTKS